MRVNIKYNDYTGFTFNGIHTSQLGLVRVSTGSRYQGNLLPSFQNFTETDGSIDGTYYFGKNNKSKSFNIDLAFDSVTEEELQEISQWLNVDIGELIFDELPFKKYYAKNTEKTNKEYLFSWQIASMILQLTKNIRNRAFHLENLLKLQQNGLPRLSAKVDFKNNIFAIKRISPNKLVEFLDDILNSFGIKM